MHHCMRGRLDTDSEEANLIRGTIILPHDAALSTKILHSQTKPCDQSAGMANFKKAKRSLQPMRVYITKYWRTKGFVMLDVEESDINIENGCLHLHGANRCLPERVFFPKDYTTSPEALPELFKKERAKHIEGLKRRLIKAEALEMKIVDNNGQKADAQGKTQ